MDIYYSPKYYYDNRFAEFREMIQSRGRDVHFSKGSTIIGVNELMHNLYYIKSGVTRFFVIGEDINGCSVEKTIWFTGKDDIFPLYGPVGHFCRFEYENQMLSAYTDVDAICISRKEALELMRDNFNFSLTMLNKYADLAGILLYESVNLLRSARRRIINFLAMYETALKPNGIILTQEEIATITGTTLPTVARELKVLRNMGIIETSRKQIVIRDAQKLYELCSDAAQKDGPEN